MGSRDAEAVARWLAPRQLDCIGIVGCGVQAEQQLRYLSRAVSCRRVLVWGRRPAPLQAWIDRCADTGFEIGIAAGIDDIVDCCRLIITTTPAVMPLVSEVRAGTHITAIGSDTPAKQEIASAILATADIVAVDSRTQCQSRGEVFHALGAGTLRGGRRAGRRGDDPGGGPHLRRGPPVRRHDAGAGARDPSDRAPLPGHSLRVTSRRASGTRPPRPAPPAPGGR